MTEVPTELETVADLLRRRNSIDAEIGLITGRPVVSGHLGEWIAARVFDITLEESATSRAIDGRFAAKPLAGRTVNVKWYGKQEGLLDVSQDPGLDYYLVMTGPRGVAASSRGKARPLVIEAVFLFEAEPLLDALRSRGVGIGVTTSVLAAHWEAAEIFPRTMNTALKLSTEQRELLELFRAEPDEQERAT